MPTDTAPDFATLIRDNEGALVRLARHYAAPGEREDLLQEMHLQLWRSLPGFDRRAALATWVYRVALNTALSHRRKPAHREQPLERAPERGDAGVPVDPATVLGDFLAALDPIQRGVLLLDLEGLEREQIAEVMGMSANAVAIRMTRLRRAFESRFLEHA